MEKRVTWADQDGNVYGSFSIQKDGFPNAGEVMECYRQKKKISRTVLAQSLHVTPRRVQSMEHNNQVFESITRRRALAEMLGIPPILFGLASRSAIRPREVEKSMPGILIHEAIDKEAIGLYEEMNRLYWNLYYTGSNSSISTGIESNIQKLQSILPYSGEIRVRVVEQLSSFYELASRVSMDQFRPHESVGYIEDALKLIDPEDAEIYGRLLYKKGMALFEARDFHRAQVALEQAYNLIKQLSTPLIGSILLQLGVVYSCQANGSTRSTAMHLFERAGGLVRSPRNFEVEGVRLDEGRYLTAYGEGLINLGRYEDAEDMLEKAREKTSPNLTKRLLMIDIQEIRLYTAQKEYLIARSLSSEVREKALALKSLRTLQTIDEITSSIPVEKRKR